MTFASRQRPGIFDARQSCVKTNVKCAPTPLIRLSKTVVQLCYTFDANQNGNTDKIAEMLFLPPTLTQCCLEGLRGILVAKQH